MTRLINQFQYSHSRHKAFAECQRKYYLSAYEMWDGWDLNAPPEKKLAYRLNKQTNLPAWAGMIVHESIKHSIIYGFPDHLPPLETIQGYAIRTMRTGWRQALEKRYKFRPKGNLNLFELYYGLDVPRDTAYAVKDKVLLCLANFVKSKLPKIAGIPRKDRLETDDFTSFLLNGVKVALAIDFAYRRGDEIHIYDWKTGRKREEHLEQVNTYALYAASKWGVDPENIFVHLCYLHDDYEECFQMTEPELLSMQEKIEQRAESMARKLRGPTDANEPLPIEKFPMTEDRWKCERCSFYESCYGTREIEKITKETA